VHPVLLDHEWLRLPTYFTCLMVGFSLASFVLRREALRRGIPPRQVLDLGLWIVPAALIGARVAHWVLVEPAAWRADPFGALWRGGGFVFYGGAAGGLLMIALWARRTGHPAVVYGDCLAPATALGLAWGRLGCLGGGCCHGRPIDWPFGVELPWGVRYVLPGPVPLELRGVPLHPAPLYEAVAALALFVGLSWRAQRQQAPGEIMAGFLVVYGVCRFVIEFFRADVTRGLYFGGALSTSQLLSMAAVAAGALLWASGRGRNPPSEAPSPGSGYEGGGAAHDRR
jgi:phosphatidylglycerol:prolipoprotein diacylglycerol transferase